MTRRPQRRCVGPWQNATANSAAVLAIVLAVACLALLLGALTLTL